MPNDLRPMPTEVSCSYDALPSTSPNDPRPLEHPDNPVDYDHRAQVWSKPDEKAYDGLRTRLAEILILYPATPRYKSTPEDYQKSVREKETDKVAVNSQRFTPRLVCDHI
jgi:hypothetical protein